MFTYKLLYGHIFISLVYKPRSSIAGACGQPLLNFLKNHKTVICSLKK